MEEKVIKWLDEKDLKILKQIIIVSDRQNGEIELGSILYTRPMTDTYNLMKQKEEDEKESKEGNSYNRLLHEYPKQKNYPNDRMDEIILGAVKKVYPKSFLRNDTIFFNVDLEKLQVLKNRRIINASIFFSPEFSSVSSLLEAKGREFKAPGMRMNIYSYYQPEYLDGQIFYANYNIQEAEILNNLKTIKFE